MIELTDDIIDLQQVLEHVTDAQCGAEVLFVGTTRQWTQQADGTKLETSHLIYEAYPEMALEQLERLETEARRRWSIVHVAIVHRLGKVPPKEASVAVAVSSPHRSESFEAARWLIDTLKHDIPIWKQEHYVQNGPEWIHPTAGNCRCEPASPTAQTETTADHSTLKQPGHR